MNPESSRFQRFALVVAAGGEFIGGYIAGPLVFILVLAGIIEATGAAPGVLSGPVGAVISFMLHAFWGISQAVFAVMGWLGVLLVTVGLLATIRHRAPWYTALLGLLLILGSTFATELLTNVSDFFGGASPWDGAAFWGAIVATYIQLGARLPLWGNEIWNWPSRQDVNYVRVGYFRRFGLLQPAYMGSDSTEGMGKNIVHTLDAALCLGLILVAWHAGGWGGLVLAILVLATLFGIARGLLWLIGGTIVSLLIVTPLSAVLALWQPSSDVRAGLLFTSPVQATLDSELQP